MKVIAKDHDIIIKGGRKTIKYCADGDYSNFGDDKKKPSPFGANLGEAAKLYSEKQNTAKMTPKNKKTNKVKSLFGSGKVQDTLGKAQGVLGALGGGASTQSETLNVPPPTEEQEGLTTGAKVAIGIGVVAIIAVMIYVSKTSKK